MAGQQLWQMCPYGCGTKITANLNSVLGGKVAAHMDRCPNRPKRGHR